MLTASVDPVHTQTGSPVDELSLSELVTGILFYTGARKFPEQALLGFFNELQRTHPSNARRFGVRGAPGNFRSEPLRRTLSFLEMYKILEIPPPNPVDQFYRVRPGMLDALQEELRSRDVLPKYGEALEKLAKEFLEKLSS